MNTKRHSMRTAVASFSSRVLTALLILMLVFPALPTGMRTASAILFNCDAVTDVPASECEALVSLYISTSGTDWTNSTNWLTGTTVDDWYGVTVNTGHVTILNLAYNNLVGTIPSELGYLGNLVELYLHYNTLSGSIPTTLGSLSNLQTLILYSNSLSGSIPVELGSLSALTTLSLYSNELTGSIPSELGNISSMVQLNLQNNYISGSIPTSLGNLSNLLDLNLAGNQLSGSIPVELGNLSTLQFLDLGGNSLTGSIPTQLGGLSNVYHLSFYSNQLEGTIPAVLGNLSNLQYLNLGQNNLTGSIPPELGNLTLLTGLHIFYTGITGSIPSQLGNLTNLQYLSLYDNSLNGSIPSAFGNLAELQAAYLMDNQLTGSIPPEVGNLAKLRDLWLENNELSGSIPSQLGNLKELRRLHLQENNLIGSVPTSFTNLTKLTEFYFYDTVLCEPATSAYLGWKATVTDYQGTGLSCSIVSPKEDEKLTSSKITFVWDPVTDAVKYKIQLSTEEDFSTLIFSINTPTNTYTYPTSLVSGKTYYWRVRALVGTSWTDPIAYRFYSMNPLAAPGLAAPSDGDFCFPDLTLAWFTATNAVQYKLQVARDAAFTDRVFNGKVADEFKDFTDLGTGKYYWRVKSIEAGGLKSGWSAVRSFTVVKVFPPILYTPENLAEVGSNLTLNWSSSDGAVQYKIQVAKDPAFTKLIVNEKITETSKELSGLSARDYFWRVKAINAEGFKSPWSQVFRFTVVIP